MSNLFSSSNDRIKFPNFPTKKTELEKKTESHPGTNNGRVRKTSKNTDSSRIGLAKINTDDNRRRANSLISTHNERKISRLGSTKDMKVGNTGRTRAHTLPIGITETRNLIQVTEYKPDNRRQKTHVKYHHNQTTEDRKRT